MGGGEGGGLKNLVFCASLVFCLSLTLPPLQGRMGQGEGLTILLNSSMEQDQDK